jgi:hypothetical protein
VLKFEDNVEWIGLNLQTEYHCDTQGTEINFGDFMAAELTGLKTLPSRTITPMCSCLGIL